MAFFKVGKDQYLKLKDNPVHYELNMVYNQKEDAWEFECNSVIAQRVKAVIDD